MNCQYSISENEFINYLESGPPQLALFSLNTITPYTISLSCLLYDNGVYYQYIANSQVRSTVGITNIVSAQMNISEDEGQYDLILRTFQNGSNQQESINYNIFFDIITSYNIYLKRQSCLQSDPKYSQNKSLEEFNNYINKFDDMDLVSLLNIYLGINSIVTGHSEGFELIRDFSLEEYDSEIFNTKLWEYWNLMATIRSLLIESINTIMTQL